MDDPLTDNAVLIVDDETNMRHMLGVLLKREGYDVSAAEDGRGALDLLEAGHTYRYILCDIRMPRMDGLAFLKAARSLLTDTTVIMMSAYATMETAIAAMKLGAYDYISKPFKTDEVQLALSKAAERERLKKENRRLRHRVRSLEDRHRFGQMIGKSRAMQDVFALAEKSAGYDVTVLITGESGTGKELIAKGIHLLSRRAVNPLVAVNCAGIPEPLIESELFGHCKGAFTDALEDKPGLFSMAHTGTFFLDEVGELPSAFQVKLLRVLQEREIRPVGGTRTRKVDVRIIAATSRRLEAAVQEGRFREDLFYRLNVFPIRLPPLRERPEDIPLLAGLFIRKYADELAKPPPALSRAATEALLSYRWPGNVRELENAMERGVLMTDGTALEPRHLPERVRECQGNDAPDAGAFSLKRARQALEKTMIQQALEETGGNRTHAARLLEISHPSLLSKMKLYEIE